MKGAIRPFTYIMSVEAQTKQFVYRYLTLLDKFNGKLDPERLSFLAYSNTSKEFEDFHGRRLFGNYKEFKEILARHFLFAKFKNGTHKQRSLYYGAHVEGVNRLEIFERDGYACQYCKKRVAIKHRNRLRWATIDHVIPLSKGGAHSPDNIVTACFSCNSRKGNRIPNTHNNGKSF
jgi:DNA-directed RNA polymerase subunit RPC12/RpoP